MVNGYELLLTGNTVAKTGRYCMYRVAALLVIGNCSQDQVLFIPGGYC
jgi:hypothetical protein